MLRFDRTSRMLKKTTSSGKAEVKAKVEAKMPLADLLPGGEGLQLSSRCRRQLGRMEGAERHPGEARGSKLCLTCI